MNSSQLLPSSYDSSAFHSSSLSWLAYFMIDSFLSSSSVTHTSFHKSSIFLMNLLSSCGWCEENLRASQLSSTIIFLFPIFDGKFPSVFKLNFANGSSGFISCLSASFTLLFNDVLTVSCFPARILNLCIFLIMWHFKGGIIPALWDVSVILVLGLDNMFTVLFPRMICHCQQLYLFFYVPCRPFLLYHFSNKQKTLAVGSSWYTLYGVLFKSMPI